MSELTMPPAQNATPLAIALALLWERVTGRDFPGGVHAAAIRRQRPAYWEREEGAWSWYLSTSNDAHPHSFWLMGSQWPASEAVRDFSMIEISFNECGISARNVATLLAARSESEDTHPRSGEPHQTQQKGGE